MERAEAPDEPPHDEEPAAAAAPEGDFIVIDTLKNDQKEGIIELPHPANLG